MAFCQKERYAKGGNGDSGPGQKLASQPATFLLRGVVGHLILDAKDTCNLLFNIPFLLYDIARISRP